MPLTSLANIDDLRFREIVTPATPATDTNVIYFKSDGLLYTLDDLGVESIVSSSAMAIFQDQKANGTQGGAFTAGSFQTRDLNTVVVNTIGAVLSANQFILLAGNYSIIATAPAFAINNHKCKLRNITDVVDVPNCIGSNQTTTNEMTDSIIIGHFTIASTKTFELQHQCGTTRTVNGFGVSNAFSVDEIYSQVQLRLV